MTVVVVLAIPPTLTDPGTNPPTQLSPSAPSTSKTSRTKAHPRTDRTGISSLVSGAGRARLPTLRLGYKEGSNENLAARYPVYRAWGDERWEIGEEKIVEEVWEEKTRAEEAWYGEVGVGVGDRLGHEGESKKLVYRTVLYLIAYS